jgi:hypothetical protein
LALTGVGIEHSVRLGGLGALHGEERWVLAAAIALACASLSVLAATRIRHTAEHRGGAASPVFDDDAISPSRT